VHWDYQRLFFPFLFFIFIFYFLFFNFFFIADCHGVVMHSEL